MVALGLRRRLLVLARQLKTALAPDAAALPDLASCIDALCDAINESLPTGQIHKRGRGRTRDLGDETPKRITRLMNKLCYARRMRDRAETRLRALQKAKEHDAKHRMTAYVLAKVGLSSPSASARSFADAWSDLVGVGASGCGRTTIGCARDGFSIVVRCLYLEMLENSSRRSALARSLVAAQCASVGACARGTPLVVGVALHFHDEASLRLRSELDSSRASLPGYVFAPSRGRSSKVMQHAVWVEVGSGEPRRLVPTELCALANKSARVVARSLFEVLRTFAACLQAGFGAVSAAEKPWLFHIVVGDGVNTNAAAARILLSWALRDLAYFTYFLFVVKCASHQANLAICSAVTGIPAVCAACNSREAIAMPDSLRCRADRAGAAGSPHRAVCGVIVRIFKYLVSMYYEEFLSSLSAHCARLSFTAQTPADAQRAEMWSGLATLYGEGVIPQMLLACLNSGLDSWTHSLPAAPAPVAARAPGAGEEDSQQHAVRNALAEILRRRLLVVDEHPTMTRFFTFKGHVEAMLLLHFLGIAPSVFTTGSIKVLLKKLEAIAERDCFPSVAQHATVPSAHGACSSAARPHPPHLRTAPL